MTDAPQPQWIVDHDDTLQTRASINDLHDLAAGVIVVHPQPTTKRLAYDVLVALEKDFRSPGWPSGAQRAWKLAELWLTAESIRHIVVYGAHRLAATDLKLLSEAAAPARATVWPITCSGDQADVPRHTVTELVAACGCAEQNVGEEPERRRRAIVCSSADFVTFRSRCYRLLGLGVVRAVDERLTEVRWEVERWLDKRTAHPKRFHAANLLEHLSTMLTTKRTRSSSFEPPSWRSSNAATC